MKGKRETSARKPLPRWAKITLRIGRKLIVPVCCLIALWVGLYVGYAVLGEGSGSDVFKLSTWKHMMDLVFAN